MLPLRRILATLLLVCLLPVSTTAQAMISDVASLRGITKVKLTISPLRSDLAAFVDASALRTKIELQLREHGLQLFGPGEAGKLGTWLIVFVNSVHSGAAWAISVEVCVQQPATIMRNNFVDLTAITWQGGETSVVGDDHVAGTVLSDASDAIDDFLNAWLEANPPPR